MSDGGGANAPNPSTAQARVLVDELARGGLTDAVICPGSRSTALAIALHEEPRIRAHIHPDERSAAFVALGLARATGRAAAVLVTSGSAVANLHPAVVEADHGGVPLLLLTADRPPELRGTGANQTIDQVGLFGPSVRSAVDLGVAEDRGDAVRTWRATVARCLAEAAGLGGPPGPVQLNVPFREPTVPVTDDGRSRAEPFRSDLAGRGAFEPWVTVERGVRVPSAASLDRLAADVTGVERGVLVVAGDAGISRELADAAAAATGWPLVVEGHAAARGAAAALRAGTWLLGDPAFTSPRRADLVIRIGRPTVVPHTALVGPGTREVLIDPDGRWADPGRSMSRLVVADPSVALEGIVARAPVRAGSDWRDEWRAADAAAVDVVRRAVVAGTAPRELALVSTVLATRSSDTALLVGSSGPIRDLDLAVDPPGGAVLANRGASGIDGLVATALGAALGAGAATAIVGDVSFLHDAGAFLLRPDAPDADLTVVVVANGGGALFDRLPAAVHAPAFDRLFITPHGRRAVDVARAHGVAASEVGIEGLAAELAARPEGPRVLEVPVDRGDEARRRAELVTAVRAAVAAAGSGAGPE